MSQGDGIITVAEQILARKPREAREVTLDSAAAVQETSLDKPQLCDFGIS